MPGLPHIPAPGEPVNVQVLRDLVAHQRSATPVPGRGHVRRLAGGTTIEPDRTIPIRKVGNENPWWRVRMKDGSATVAQVSGGFVRLVNGYQGSPYLAPNNIRGLAHGTTLGDPYSWTDVTLITTPGTTADGIYAVHKAVEPYDSLVLVADDDTATHNGATYVPGVWEWTRVADYELDNDGAVTMLRRSFFAGDTIRVDVVPAGTIRMYGVGAVPPGWKMLDGTGGVINAYGLAPRMTLGALFGDLNGLIDGTVAPGEHVHPLTLTEIRGTAGADRLGRYAFPSSDATTGAGPGVASSTREKALAVVYAIKL